MFAGALPTTAPHRGYRYHVRRGCSRAGMLLLRSHSRRAISAVRGAGCGQEVEGGDTSYSMDYRRGLCGRPRDLPAVSRETHRGGANKVCAGHGDSPADAWTGAIRNHAPNAVPVLIGVCSLLAPFIASGPFDLHGTRIRSGSGKWRQTKRTLPHCSNVRGRVMALRPTCSQRASGRRGGAGKSAREMHVDRVARSVLVVAGPCRRHTRTVGRT